VDTVVAAGVHGARAAVVVTSGFAEMGAEGTRLQHELTSAARAHDLRLVGPNCLGLLDNQPDVRLDATFGGDLPPAGGLAIASQSGGVGIVVLETARRIGLGVRHFVSLGNKADVSSNDLLAAWMEDPGITAAALYLDPSATPPSSLAWRAASASASRCWLSWAVDREAGNGPGRPIPQRQPRRRSAWTRSSPRQGSSGAPTPMTSRRPPSSLPSSHFLPGIGSGC
jgi:hypothetical protein